MLKTDFDPHLVSLSTRVYAFLLLFYPIRFRREYGPHMAQVFRDSCLTAYRRAGLSAMFGLWALTLFDWFKTIIEEHLERRTEMTYTKYIRLSGWALALSGLSYLFGFLASSAVELLQQPMTGKMINRYSRISDATIVAGGLFLAVGFVGMLLRYRETAGSLALGTGTFFAIVSSLGTWFVIIGSEVAWSIWSSSLLIAFVCLTIFGFQALRNHLLPRWNAVPIFTGMGIPILFLESWIIELISGHWLNTNLWSLLITVCTTIGLVVLGYLVQADAGGQQETLA